MMNLDRTALSFADLAYLDEPGTIAQKVAAAIAAYNWILARPRDDLDEFFMPSLLDWRKYRDTLGNLR